MKVIRDGICYVNFDSLLRRSLTKYMDNDTEVKGNSIDDMIVITNRKGVKVISEREDILDYDTVKDVSSVELDEMVIRVEKDMEPFIYKWNHTPYAERDKLYKDEAYKENYEPLKDYYFELIEYRANREKIDDKINLFINSHQKVKKL